MRAYSCVYDALWDHALTDAVADVLAARLDGHRTLLDVGAGTGLIAARLIDHGFEVICTEPDPSMRRRCRARLPGVACYDLSIESLHLAPALIDSVDALIAINVVHMAADPAQAVARLRELAGAKTLVVVSPRSDGTVLRTVRAMLDHGAGLGRVVAFVVIHFLMAPLTLLTASGLRGDLPPIEGDLHVPVGHLFSLNVWLAGGRG